MRAAVTTEAGVVAVAELDPPRRPARDEILLRPLTVGVCGSDLHLYDGDSVALSGADRRLPRVQGHEIGAEVVHDPSGRLAVGRRAAVWPLRSCGTCHRCRVGAVNACLRLSILGVHRDGGLAEQLVVPATHVMGLGEVSDVVAALVEPLSVGVHAVARSGAGPGDRALVLGGGAVGQGVCLALADRGVATLLVDPVPERSAAGSLWGAETATACDPERVRDWTGGRGADVVLDATGAASVLDIALDVVRVGGTVVEVGLSSTAGPVHPGTLAVKELTVLGSSCCTWPEFARAAQAAERWSAELDRIPVLRHPLEHCGEAFEQARTATAVKVLVDVASRERA